MLKRLLLAGFTVTVGSVAIVALHATPRVAKERTLTALDYIEIEQLNTQYAQAMDSCADKGGGIANLFTADGVFVYKNGGQKAEGREALAAFAGRPVYCAPPNTPLTIGHIALNVVIEPSTEGAIGKSYMLEATITPDGMATQFAGGGKYYDVYVKTPEGWRFKSRTFVRGTQRVDVIPASELSHHPLPR